MTHVAVAVEVTRYCKAAVLFSCHVNNGTGSIKLLGYGPWQFHVQFLCWRDRDEGMMMGITQRSGHA